MKTRIFQLLTVGLVSFLMLTGCAQPPDELRQSAEGLPEQIDNVRSELDRAKADYDAKLRENKYSFLKEYTPAQQRTDRFEQAKVKLDQADRVVNDKVNPIVDTYEAWKAD